jgi:hypothetical protein
VERREEITRKRTKGEKEMGVVVVVVLLLLLSVCDGRNLKPTSLDFYTFRFDDIELVKWSGFSMIIRKWLLI